MHRPTARREWTTAFVVCTAIGLVALRSGAFTRAGEGEREIAAEPGLLLMNNGVIVEGLIMRSGDDYLVQKPGGGEGRMKVPGDLVKFQCATLADAYERLHKSAQRQNTAAQHLLLARWCISNKMLDEARAELQDALALEPERAETREMLSRINDLLDPTRPRSSPSPSAAPATVAPVRTAVVTESLGSLSREEAQQFTRRIQPILVNNCAVSGCHGADSETGFRLQRVTPGGDTSRLASERNLAEVLKEIDFKNPRSSPLVKVPDKSHGRRGKPALAGPRGAAQLEDIRRWVQAVAQSEAVREKRDAFGGAIEQASAQVAKPDPRNRSRGTPAAQASSDDSPAAGSSSTKDPFGVNGGADPFDPTEFNRGSTVRVPRR